MNVTTFACSLFSLGVLIYHPSWMLAHATEYPILAYFDRDTYFAPAAIEKGSYRKLLGKNEQRHYIVQDFYQDNDEKFSDPFVVKNDPQPLYRQLYQQRGDDLNHTKLNYQDLHIEGTVTHWHQNGNKRSQAIFQHNSIKNYQEWNDQDVLIRKDIFQPSKNGIPPRTNHWITRFDDEGKKVITRRQIMAPTSETHLTEIWYQNGQESLTHYVQSHPDKRLETTLLNLYTPDGKLVARLESNRRAIIDDKTKLPMDTEFKTSCIIWQESGEESYHGNDSDQCQQLMSPLLQKAETPALAVLKERELDLHAKEYGDLY